MGSLEFRRQIFHLLLGVAIVFLIKFGAISKNIILAIIVIGLLLSHLIKKKTKIPIVYQLLRKFERDEELNRFPGRGIIFYFIGIYFVMLLFTKEIVMASIMVLALGDSISHLYGLHFGKIKHPLSRTKFLEGTVAGVFAGFIGASAFVPWHEAFFASLAAMTVEAIEIKIGAEQVNDNLIVPLVVGAVISALRFLK
ncbi:MAG: diacylglycerol/polyprenol kinase family protein [Nanoarchaeota archaeon]